MTPPVPDGPDTELAAIVADLDDLHTEAASVAMRSEGSVTAAAEEVRDDVASIRDRLRAVLARPAAGRDLTAQDVQRAYDGTMRWEPIANYLNRIARPAVARTDGQCTCGDPSAADLVHHTEAPCRTVEELRTGRTDGQPHPDPRGRYDVPDPYDHPGWPLVSRIVAIATDTDPTMPNETDGVDNAVTGLLADQSWRDHVAMADVMGLVGDWGTDDVVQAVTDALHEYPRLRARVARTDGQPPADPEDSPWAALVRELKAHADQVAAGDLSGLPTTEYQCGLVDGYRGAAGRVRQVLIQQSAPAAPTDDAAVSDGRVWSDGNCGWGWVCERCGYRSVAWWPDRDVAERAAAEHERDRCPATGRPVRDSQGCES